MLIKVAWRNVWRHKTRSAVIIIAVMFGLWAGLFTQAYMNGMIEERVSIAIRKEVSHIQLHHPAFESDYDAKFVIPGGIPVMSFISRMKEVKAVSGRLLSQGMVATATGSAGIKINGVDPAAEDSVTNISSNIIEGKYLSAEAVNEVLVGEKLLKKLKLKLNSKVVLTFLDREGNITSGAFRIKGIFRTQNTPFDESNIFVERQDLAALLNTDNGLHEIAVLLHSNESLEPAAGILTKQFPLVKTETWKEVAPEMNLIIATADQSLLIYMGIIMLALAFGIVNTMLMAVLERTREIGMLMALGMSRVRVFMMILLETTFLVFTGAPLGVLLGFLTTLYFGIQGIDVSVYKDVYASFGFSEIVHPVLRPRDYYVILELVVLTSLVSALYPARKALSLNPAEAIRK